MSRFIWMMTLAVAVGCGAPASDTVPVAESGQEAAHAEGFVMTAAEFNVAGAPVVELDAPGMHCEACAANICKAIKDKPGVVDVKANAETKVVSVAVSDTEFETDFVIEAIAEAGFGEATVLEATPPVEDDTATEETGEPS